MDKKPRDAGEKLTRDEERTPDQVRREIAQTREELGDTVAALAEKTDVKAQAKQAVEEAKATATGKVNDIKETVNAKRDDFTSAAQEATPDSVGDAGAKLSELVRRYRVPLIVVAALGVGVLVGRGTSR